MGDTISSGLWELPRIRGTIRQIVMDIQDGFCLWILTPPWIDHVDFQEILIRRLEEIHLSVDVLNLDEFCDETPLMFLCRVFPVLLKYNSLEQIVREPELPGAILVSNFEDRSPEEQLEWSIFQLRWSNACRSYGSYNSLIFLTPARVASQLKMPSPDVRFSYQIITGFPTALETRMLCRLRSESIDAQSLWREHLISSVAGPDVHLGDFLWDCILKSQEEIEIGLREFGGSLGWNATEIKEKLNGWHPSSDQKILPNDPRELFFQLIGEGYIWSTPEYGEEIHSSALAILEMREEIRHRIWRAQVSLILPMADEIRVGICRALFPLTPDRENSNDLDILELGPLKTYLYDTRNKYPNHTLWLKIISDTWFIRNMLAHYQPVSYSLFYNLWNEFHELKKNLVRTEVKQLFIGK